ncbi:hypothetical protein HXZ62_14635 [Empedobacter falsenii]|uniref:hypothetical protein n=1 Tax=Empedobacter falsenii TaxID=343874 RepID=UPI002577C97E|nr:hypothetical protein [Empedobacter falsenii]MDM1063784.1 hypothetical protein [Empedobacter falsenii]
MSENSNTSKNPLELALEAFLNGTEKIEQTKIELDNLLKNIHVQQQKLNKLEVNFSQDRNEILSIFSNNLKLYQNINNKVSIDFNDSLKDYQAHFLNSIADLKDTKLNLDHSDRKLLENAEIQITKFRKFSYYVLGVIFLLLFTTILSGYFSTNFYKTSVLTKTEARNEFLNQLKLNNQTIVDKNKLNALKNEREIVNIWMNENPNDKKSYIISRNAIIKSNSDKTFFNDFTSEDVRE